MIRDPAYFVSYSFTEITKIFRNTQLVCDEAPGDVRDRWGSGTKLDLEKKAQKMQRAVNHLLSHEARPVCDTNAAKDWWTMLLQTERLNLLPVRVDSGADGSGT